MAIDESILKAERDMPWRVAVREGMKPKDRMQIERGISIEMSSLLLGVKTYASFLCREREMIEVC